MKVSTVWSATFAVGLTGVIVGLSMCFLADHHWLVSYSLSLLFERMGWPILLAGALLYTLGSVGVLARLSNKAALLSGIASIAVSLLIPMVIEALLNVSVFNVHSWTFSFLVPVFFGAFIGLTFILVGCLRLIFRYRQMDRAAKS